MNDDNIKSLGLRARAFKASLKGRARPSNDLLFLWFVGEATLVYKRDVQLFDVWLRSKDGVARSLSPNGLQHSIFPSGFSVSEANAASLDWMVYLVTGRLWALTAGGVIELRDKVSKLPGSDLPALG